mgnify:CR=1 FL=1
MMGMHYEEKSSERKMPFSHPTNPILETHEATDEAVAAGDVSYAEEPEEFEEFEEFEEQPSGLQFDPEALESLGWSKITDFLASLCRTAWGAQRARHLPFLATRKEIEQELQQVSEALWLLEERGEELPIATLADLRPACKRLEKGGSLDASQLLELSYALEMVSGLRRFLHSHQDELPSIWEKGELLESLVEVRREIEQAIDENGKLKDTASWELETLRQEVRTSHERIRRKLQEYLASPRSRYLMGSYYTLREDRYVLPVNVSEQARFPGIVYGTSGSGATIYIEPQPLVSLNNALRMAENNVAQEEARILRKLSQLSAKYLPELRANLEILRDLDLVCSKVRFAERMEATIPVLAEPKDKDGFHLKQARHPLLILKEVDVVPNDLVLGGEHHCLVFSGPNTGGKTVSLKTLGICALLTRAGLPIPAEEGSSVPLFDTIFTDIGDHQSIEHDLSTFSGQILKLQSILQKATAETLVLIDEIVVGTDPEQGCRLAGAILQELADNHAMIAVTTHYEYLKAMAYEDPRFENACVGFDLQKFEPTYRVYIGTPGVSSALEIARRLGLSESVCKRVESMLTDKTDRFETIVSRLEQQYEELYEERDRATRARQRLEKELLAIEHKQDELNRLKERLLAGEETGLRRDLRQARDTIRQTVHGLQSRDKDIKKVRRAEQRIHKASKKAVSAIKEARTSLRQEPAPSRSQLKPGTKVQIISMKTKAEVLEAPGKNSKDVYVQAGALRIRVPIDDLKVSGAPAGAPKKQARKKQPNTYQKTIRKLKQKEAAMEVQEEERKREFFGVQSRDNTCDLRGKRVDEALEEAEAFLDDCFKREFNVAFLIHGHGTGALRKAIRTHCRISSYVAQFRPGEKGEGGDGVTVVQLA